MSQDVSIKVYSSDKHASTLSASICGNMLPRGLLDVKFKKDDDGLCYAYFKYYAEKCEVDVNGQKTIYSAESIADMQKNKEG